MKLEEEIKSLSNHLKDFTVSPLCMQTILVDMLNIMEVMRQRFQMVEVRGNEYIDRLDEYHVRLDKQERTLILHAEFIDELKAKVDILNSASHYFQMRYEPNEAPLKFEYNMIRQAAEDCKLERIMRFIKTMQNLDSKD